MISVEELTPEIFVVRNHPEGGYGSSYNGVFIVQLKEGKHYIKVMLGPWKIDKELITKTKEHFGTDRLYYERNTDLTKTKVI